MNYNSVIFVGLVALTAIWWVVHGARNYPGPHLPHMEEAGKRVQDVK
jgi:choline transport protein